MDYHYALSCQCHKFNTHICFKNIFEGPEVRECWLEGAGAVIGLHAYSGKNLPGVLLRIVKRLSMPGSR